MSHRATEWAIRQKGLKPATKIVLWHLCDRHHPDNGCFPKQETLAADCEMSRSTLNLHLSKLEELGLIRRDAGREAGSMKHRPTRYWLAFEGEETVSENRTKTVSENRTEAPKTVSEKREKPCPKNSEIHVRKPDTNSVREPVREPVSDAREARCIREALSEVVTEETATAFIAHRKAKRAKLTLHAAQLIAGKIRGHPAPDAVVLESIANGWTGVFPDRVRAQPPRNTPSVADIMAKIAAEDRPQ